ncbi:MAG: DUF4214 domain-containing protein [Chloroflexi bacterium]|nr:DUF4214 domain-containing protein [Chloroflexota bacterium]
MKKPLFITALFRTGSTMLWNMFRQLPQSCTFYEPLHDYLPSYLKYPAEVQKSHLHVKSYFDEYLDTPKAILLHQSDFANYKLFLDSEDSYPELYVYIKALVESVPTWKIPILQFNRIGFRLPWIKKNFPDAILLHLYRNPRDQWFSTLASFNIDVDRQIDFDGYDLTTWARDLIKQFPFLSTQKIEHVYQRFYYIWKLSFLAGQRLSHFSVSYEDILREPRKLVSDILKFADLYSDENLEICLKIVETKPERAWVKDRDDAWFDDMERKCESVLDELGLNKNFALIPLSEIQAQSAKFMALLNDPEYDRWVHNSYRKQLSSERIASYEINQNLNQAYKNAINTINSLQWQLNQNQAERDAIQSQLNQIKAERDAIQSQLNQIQIEFDIFHEKLNRIQGEREQIHKQLEEVQAQLKDALIAQEALKEELCHVYNSRSYRITAPMRAIFGYGRIIRDKIFHPQRFDKENLSLSTQLSNNSPESESSTSLRPAAQSQSTSTVSSIMNSSQPEFSSNQSDQIPDIDLDEIMEKIRLEVARRKTQTLQVDEYDTINVKETQLFRFIKKVQLTLKKLPFYKQIYGIAINFKALIPQYQPQPINVTDLLKYDDEEFINHAYRVILKREPDNSGYDYYLYALKNNRLNKVEILGRLRYSKEGRQLRTKVKGLMYQYILSTLKIKW